MADSEETTETMIGQKDNDSEVDVGSDTFETQEVRIRSRVNFGFVDRFPVSWNSGAR